MSNALTLFDRPQLDVPSHLRDFLDEEGGNIQERQSVPSLGYEGKVWTITMDGEKQRLMKVDADGDETPVSVMRVVVLDYNQRRGRSYYPGAYDPANPSEPECWSEDGVAPHPAVAEPKSKRCETCPMAAKGSRVTEQGKAVTACSQHRMLAVVPAGKMDGQPLRMKIAVTSDYDKQSPELAKAGWFAFSNYIDFLRTKGVKHTAALVTKMRFDPNVAYPKVMFSPDRWVEEGDEAEAIREQVRSEEVAQLLKGYTPAGADGKPLPAAKDDDEDDIMPAPKKAAAVVMDDDDDEPAPKPKAAPKRAKAVVMDDDDDEPAPKAASKGDTKAEKVSTEVPADVAELLDQWDD